MRFTLENSKGKPVVKLAGENKIVAEDLAALHKLFKAQADVSTEEIYWLGLCCVMFAIISLLKYGNQLSQTNILKVLDEFYFPFSDQRALQSFQMGVNDGIRLARQGGDRTNITDVFAAKLGCQSDISSESGTS